MRPIVIVTLMAALAACGSKPEPQQPVKAPGDTSLVEISLDEAGNRYVIDTRTETCFLVMTTVEPPVAGRVSCVKLAETVPAAKTTITWLTPERPPPESDGLSYAELDKTAREMLSMTLDSALEKISDNEFEIDGLLLDSILDNSAAFSRGARIVPSIKNGKPNGFKLYAIRPSSVFANLGLMNGDTIHAINGYYLTSPDKALEIYTKIREADEVTVDLTRRGKPVRILYRIMR